MAHEAPALSIARLRSLWDAETAPSMRRALTAAVCAGVFVAAHVARLGTLPARAIAGAGLALLASALIARSVVARRFRGDARRTIVETVGRADPDLGGATLRALTLAERAEKDDRVGSPELAALHLRRLLARAPLTRILERAQRAATRWASAGLALGAAALAAVAIEPSRIVEGLDVLAARRGEAPLDLPWLREVEMVAAAPEYLHAGSEVLVPFSTTMQPRGTVVTVRGRPLHDGRALVLTDGAAEVPFVDDGGGGVLARWTLSDTTTLRVAARFGGVRIRQGDAQRLVSIDDDAPRVTLEGAPRTVKLLDEPSIPLHYDVSDDHGLREVDLVLRAGTKEERRVLSRPAADAKVDRGGYELRARDPFFRRTYVPVEVRIEARDNDPIAGPKWGKSEAILVIPPQVGEPEARRYAALAKARDALTDLLADRVGQKPPAAPGTSEHAAHEAEVQAAAVAEVRRAIAGDYGGLRVRGATASLARGQLSRLDAALAAEKRATTRATHQKLLDETESVLLAFDAGLRGLGYRDAQAVAQRLADVADEAAGGAMMAATGDRAGGEPRVQAAVTVLDGGGAELRRLDELGLDLGEIVANDLRRIARARGEADWTHAELAARDLAARLRRPEPSFGGGGRGGVESGAPGARGVEPGEASSADQDVAQSARELEDLARDHAAEMNEVEGALDRAASKAELEALREEAKKHAEAIRKAVQNLPQSGAPAGSAESAAAAGREQAEAMAGALEQGHPEDAVRSGQSAMRSLGDAKRLGEQGRSYPDERAGREAEASRGPLQDELTWAEEALRALQRSASERARGDLEKSGKREGSLADRARDLRKKGEGGDGRMPEEMLERLGDAEQAMRDAQRSLSEGDGDQGQARQREAQRLLEMSRGEDQPQEGDAEGEGRQMSKQADIPDKDKHKGPEDFRRRVLDGLGRAAEPRLKEAVKRYAEGLLK